MPMNQLQTAFETAFQTQFKLNSLKLAVQLFERKAKGVGLTLSKFQLARIRKRLEAGDGRNFKLHFPKVQTKESRKIIITKEDVRALKKQYKSLLKGFGLGNLIDEISDSVSSQMLTSLKQDWPRQSKYERSILNGFEKRLRWRWGEPLELLAMLIKLALELGADVNEESRKGESSKTPYTVEVLTRLHARACQIASEVFVLLKSGFADGAMARWRTLHEIVVTAFFIQEHGEAVAERYLLHAPVDSYKAAQQYQRHCKRLGYTPLSSKELERIKDSYNAAVTRFGPSFGGGYGWAAAVLKYARPTFADIEQHVSLDHFRPYYKMASENVHADPKGSLYRLGLGLPQEGLLLAGPSDAGLADPGQNTALSLAYATSSLLKIKCTLDIIVGLRIMMTLSKEIGEAFLRVQESLGSEAGLRPSITT
jgi:hypothetical protein